MVRRIKRTAAIMVLAAMSLALPAATMAHNAGHFFLPDGSCHAIGSFRTAPLVGPDKVVLDLIPATPQDEIGTSFAAFQGSTPILPGGCPQ
jgi:type IV secretory pathway protease TraF